MKVINFLYFFLFFSLLVLYTILACNIYANNNEKESECRIRRRNKIKSNSMWNNGNFVDLGANNGDSVIWFYNLHMKNLKYFVPYPRRTTNITKNFNTFIFEANPNLCNIIEKTVEFVKQNTKLVEFKIFCPVIVSTYEGVVNESNRNFNKNRRVVNVPVINITKFLSENIPQYDFNVMKFDVEGEEHYIFPQYYIICKQYIHRIY